MTVKTHPGKLHELLAWAAGPGIEVAAARMNSWRNGVMPFGVYVGIKSTEIDESFRKAMDAAGVDLKAAGETKVAFAWRWRQE